MARILFPLVLTIAMLSCGRDRNCVGQEQVAETMADRIADASDGIIVLNDNQVVINDLRRMTKDLGFPEAGDWLGNFLSVDRQSGLTGKNGVIAYYGLRSDNLFEDEIAVFEIENRESLLKYWAKGNEEGIREATGFDLASNPVPVELFGLLWGHPRSRGYIHGNKLVAFEGEDDVARKFLDAPPLAAKLDATSRDIIHGSGISLIGQISPEEVNNVITADWLVGEFGSDMTEAEQKWLHDLAETGMATRLGLLGLKYHDRVFQLRSHAQIGEGKSLERLVDFTKADQPWKPELGLEVEQLVLSAAIQMNAFRSSAAARVVPQVLLRESGRGNQFGFLQGNMLRILAELSGDSWNDLSAARVGLYQNDEDEQAGQLAIVGIADARKPEDVLNELRRLSRLTSPEALSVKAAERADELLRLVDELASEDCNVSDRARTRLILAGQAAVPALKKGIEVWNLEQRERAQGILNRIQTDTDAAGKAVIDPGFWTTLNPGLRLEESTGTVAGFATHTIHVTPDPSKTTDEVGEAIGVMQGMFGENWGSIQVVQVRDHFVFMIGSDKSMLERIVKNVEAGNSILTKPLRDAGMKPLEGQIQVCLNTARIYQLSGIRNWTDPEGKLKPAEGLCWVGLDFDQHAVSADALVPISQVLPFMAMGMGF